VEVADKTTGTKDQRTLVRLSVWLFAQFKLTQLCCSMFTAQ